MKRNFTHVLIILVSLIGLISCKENEEKQDHPTKKKRIEFSKEHKELEVFENYVQKVEDNKSLDRVESLFFTDATGNTTEAFAWVNEQMEIVKLQETFTLVNGQKTERTFYFLNGLKSVSKTFVSHYELDKPYFTEERSYYSLTGSVIATFGRSANTEDLSNATFNVKPKNSHAHQNALAVIQRTGDFETRFRGFDEAFERKYIVFGTEKQTTTVAFNVETPILKQLMREEKKQLNKPLEVQFSPITEADGFMFQALIDLKFPS
ncbi:MAG: hypothetical protein ACO29Q_04585 [Crocinitomicaceae bacterium]